MAAEAPAYALELRNRKKRQWMQFSMSMPVPAPVAAEVADKHSFWTCRFTMRRNGKTISETAHGATWLDAMTGAADGMRRMIPAGEEQDWETVDGVESWRIFPRLIVANGSYEDHLRIGGEAAANERVVQPPRERPPVYELVLRNPHKRQRLRFVMTMPEHIPRQVWEKSDDPFWKCSVSVEKRGKTASQDFYGDTWTAAIGLAAEAMRRMIPEDEECDWVTPEGLPSWCVFPKAVPIGWGYEFHRRVWNMVRKEDEKLQQELERKRAAGEKGHSAEAAMSRAEAAKIVSAMQQLLAAIGNADETVSRMAPGAAKSRLIGALAAMLQTSREDILLPIFRDFPDLWPEELK